jgi:hypothetical protein
MPFTTLIRGAMMCPILFLYLALSLGHNSKHRLRGVEHVLMNQSTRTANGSIHACTT